MAQNITLLGATYQDVPSVVLPKQGGGSASFTDVTDTTALASDVLSGKYFYAADGTRTLGTGSGGTITGTIVQRPDATLVKAWKVDRKVVADDEKTLPAYSTSATTILASSSITVEGIDNTNYCYAIAYRGVVIPIYNTNVQVQGRQEYTVCVALAEEIYNPANTFPSLNGSGVYVASAPTPTVAGFTQHNRHIYWNSTTNMSIYNAGTYGATMTFSQPSFGATTIFLLTPSIGVRGQNTYMKQSVYETITDIRYQYIIELWRVPRPNIGLNGFYYNDIDIRMANDLQTASHTIT